MNDPTSDALPHTANESHLSNKIQSQAQNQERDSNEEVDRTARQGRINFGNILRTLRSLIRSDCIDIFLKVLHFFAF